MLTKEAALNTACIQYLSACLAEGELRPLLTMGFKHEDLLSLNALTVQEVHLLSNLRSVFAEVRVNRQLFLRQYEIIRERRRANEYVNALLSADAPLELMQSLYGMNSADFASRRKALGLGSNLGRAPAPTEKESETIWKGYEALKVKQAELSPAEWVLLAKSTELPLRICYRTVSQWQAERFQAQRA